MHKTPSLQQNSIKPVTIRELDMYFVLDMPQGDLYNDYENISELFDTFEEAKRWAETYVGIKMNMKDL